MNSSKDPLVSVIIPAYNCEKYIDEAISSVINQTYRNLEIIVVDDGSTDGTWKKLQNHKKLDKRVHIFKNDKNLKIVGTLNFALSQSHGEYIARMDSDDWRMQNSIEKQVNFLNNHPDVVIVGGAIDVCDKGMNKINHRKYPLNDDEIRNRLFRYNPFAHPAIMVRGDILRDLRYQLNWAEDYDLYFRLGRIGKFANMKDTILKLRTHTSSISQSKVSYQEDLTLYIRLKAVFEYGYSMRFADKLYFVTQFVSKLIMPSGVRFKIFNFLRAKKT